MQEPSSGGLVGMLLPLIIMMIPLVFIIHRLAKEKNKNIVLWTVLGCIPLANYFSLIYLVGSANTQLEEKLDRVIAIFEKEGS
jgi:hypothetical protein